MKSVIKKFIATGLLLALSQAAIAGIGSGKVKVVKLDLPGKYLMFIVDDHQNPPGCVNWDHHLAMKYTGTEEQKVYLSLLLTAYSSGQSVRVVGSHSCLAGTGAEEVRDIEISRPD